MGYVGQILKECMDVAIIATVSTFAISFIVHRLKAYYYKGIMESYRFLNPGESTICKSIYKGFKLTTQPHKFYYYILWGMLSRDDEALDDVIDMLSDDETIKLRDIYEDASRYEHELRL